MRRRVVIAPNKTTAIHLEAVKREMSELGSPVVRVYDPCGGRPLEAIEGSHRLAAAAELGMPARLVRVRLRDVVEHDFADLVCPCQVSWILDYLRCDDRGPALSVLESRARRRGGG